MYMQHKAIATIVALVLIVGIGGLVYYTKQKSYAPSVDTYQTPDTSADSETTNPGIAPGEPNGSASGYTMSVVAEHNSKASCWTVISGSVYDLTSWIPNHPGGEQAILSLCGTDGTTKFNGQHGSNSRAKTVLSGFKIGTLAQ
jgi:cytochrome b involved in lipid metabolism